MAAHSDVDAHETSVRPLLVRLSLFHTGLAAPGFVDAATLPSPSTATQREVDGHEIAVICPVVASTRELHPEAGPAGSCVAKTKPLWSPAMHSVLDAQPSTSQCRSSISVWALQDTLGALALVVLMTPPVSSDATHSDVVGHETLSICSWLPKGAVC